MGKAETTRLRILGAGVDHVADAGLGTITIAGLAKRARLSKSGLFAHFHSHEALVLAVLGASRAAFEREVVDRAEAAAGGHSTRAAAYLRAWYVFCIEPRGARPPWAAALLRGASQVDGLEPAVQRALVRDFAVLRARLARVVRGGRSSGELRADLDARTFVDTFQGLVLTAGARAILAACGTGSQLRSRSTHDPAGHEGRDESTPGALGEAAEPENALAALLRAASRNP